MSIILLSESQIDCALDLRRVYDTCANDLDELSRRIGVKTIWVKSWRDRKRGLYVLKDGEHRIYLPVRDARTNDLLYGHEVCHYKHSPAGISFTELVWQEDAKQEAKANAFAALFYMPLMRAYDNEQQVYTAFGQGNEEFAQARIAHFKHYQF